MKIKGHAAEYEWNGEYGEERIYTAICKCGWSESCHRRYDAVHEYKEHIKRESKS